MPQSEQNWTILKIVHCADIIHTQNLVRKFVLQFQHTLRISTLWIFLFHGNRYMLDALWYDQFLLFLALYLIRLTNYYVVIFSQVRDYSEKNRYVNYVCYLFLHNIYKQLLDIPFRILFRHISGKHTFVKKKRIIIFSR